MQDLFNPIILREVLLVYVFKYSSICLCLIFISFFCVLGSTFKTVPYYDNSDVEEESSLSDEDIVDVLEIQQSLKKQYS